MKVLITGTSKGIGLAIAKLFLEKNHDVIGIDRLPSSIEHKNYIHYNPFNRNKDIVECTANCIDD